ncbi:MAG: DEAD/DEAH box helicase [Halioglobus sp.]|nr:DEAD/DEAH box helicase [Halioglobus sp.]
MFEELQLDRQLRLGIDALALTTATEVQQLAVPPALAGKDLLVSAETGSGKTLAYLIPLSQKILAAETIRQTGTLAVILVPTRELARQVLKQCRELLALSPLKAQAITGGADFKYQKAQLRKDPEIIVATPGRLLEHCQKRSADLRNLQTLVLDEADRMLDMGFRDDVIRIAEFCPEGKQVLLLSATLSHRGVGAISTTLLQSPQSVTVGQVRQAHSSIDHQLILADSQEHKDKLLAALLAQGGFTRALVFANKRNTATRLANLLKYQKLRCASLHGEMSTEERKQVMHQFHEGKVTIVCASDLAARGIDVSGIDLVVNYDIPYSGDNYLHRTGRTGRAGARGLAVSLASAPEWNLMVSIERYLALRFERRVLPGLKARYSGPKKLKSSGKAAGTKKKTPKSATDKKKTRARNQKNVGKRRTGSAAESTAKNDGFAPLKKKKPQS